MGSCDTIILMDRQRITITLRNDLLKKVDERIDGTKIRNRSHAIEYLLTKSVIPPISQAVILAGGEGVKMRPLTYEIPKALIPVGGKSLLEYTIESLREAEIREIILAIGHLGNKIKDHFGNGSKFGVKITYSEENNSLGTAGALANCYSLLEQKPFVILHGDILVDLNFRELIAFHQNIKTNVSTMVLTTKSDPSFYGNVQLVGNKVVEFVEKPTKKQAASHLVSTGVYVCEHEIFDYIPEKNPAMLEDVFPELAKQGKLSGFLFAGKWFDVSTPKNYAEAIAHWKL